VFAHWITVNYRESYAMHASCGILFNHESPRRGETFVTRKITRGVAQIALGLQDRIYLGNLDAQRDWGHAKDYVEGMWRILQQPEPEDYVLATGVTTPVRDFVRMSFRQIGVELEFKGREEREVGIVSSSSHPEFQLPVGKEVVAVDPKYYRPTEVDLLIGDPSKAHSKLGWKPEYDLSMLVEDMVQSDIRLFKREKLLRSSGFSATNHFE
jgi:GDPmannose 4,6-dehydratase